jgi:ribosomal protein L37AE/L43A
MAYPKRPVPYVCEQCGKDAITKPSQPRRFCSRACKNKFLSGANAPSYSHGLTRTTQMKREYENRHFKARPDRYAAKLALKAAIRRGELVKQPCEVCGEIKVHGHHDDYSKPLAVRWLCMTHHWDVHRQLRGAQAAARRAAMEQTA